MSNRVHRRDFLKTSLLAAGVPLLSFEENALLARPDAETPESVATPAAERLPAGRIGDLEISRLICGGNLISGFAHSRDLIYVSDMLRHYFTDEKVFETLALCEQQGINTAILRLDENTLRILHTYWRERGGKMQWIAQCKIHKMDWISGLQPAIDNGACAVYVHGGVADTLVKQERVDVLGRAVDFIRQNGVPAGIAGHMIDVPMAVEAAGIEVDFYMKTLNAKNYWSAGPMPRHDSVWAETPEKTIAFMQRVEKPWIAYKVLGAGAIKPSEGFQYAFEHGAGFLCVGMFDFQVQEDADIVRALLDQELKRERPWRA